MDPSEYLMDPQGMSEGLVGSDDDTGQVLSNEQDNAEDGLVIAEHGPGAIKQLKYMEKTVLKVITNNRLSYPFLKPVDIVKLRIPDYFAIIKKPMDLSTIRKKLRAKLYGNARECIDDFRLMFNNCYTYNNPHDDIAVMCRQLEDVFNKKIARLPSEKVTAVNGKKKSSGAGRVNAKSDVRDSNGVKSKNLTQAATGQRSSLSDPLIGHPPQDQSVSKMRGPAGRSSLSQDDGLSVGGVMLPSGASAPPISKKSRKRPGDVALNFSTDHSSTASLHNSKAPPRRDSLRPTIKKAKRDLDDDSAADSDAEDLYGGGETRAVDPYSMPVDSPTTARGGSRVGAEGDMGFCGSVLKEFFNKRGSVYARTFCDPALKYNGQDRMRPVNNLGVIKSKFESGQYSSALEFAEDIRNMVTACIRHNPQGSDITKNAKKLRTVFERKYNKYNAEARRSSASVMPTSYSAADRPAAAAGRPAASGRPAAAAAAVRDESEEDSSSSGSSNDDSDVEREKQLETLTIQLKMLQESVDRLTEEQKCADIKQKKPVPKSATGNGSSSSKSAAASAAGSSSKSSFTGISSAATNKIITSDLAQSHQDQSRKSSTQQPPELPLVHKPLPSSQAPPTNAGRKAGPQGRKRAEKQASHRQRKSGKSATVVKGADDLNESNVFIGTTEESGGRCDEQNNCPFDGDVMDYSSTNVSHSQSNDNMVLQISDVMDERGLVDQWINTEPTPREPSTPITRPVLHTLPPQPMRPSATAAPKPQHPIKSSVTSQSVIKHSSSNKPESADLKATLAIKDIHDVKDVATAQRHTAAKPTNSAAKSNNATITTDIDPINLSSAGLTQSLQQSGRRKESAVKEETEGRQEIKEGRQETKEGRQIRGQETDIASNRSMEILENPTATDLSRHSTSAVVPTAGNKGSTNGRNTHSESRQGSSVAGHEVGFGTTVESKRSHTGDVAFREQSRPEAQVRESEVRNDRRVGMEEERSRVERDHAVERSRRVSKDYTSIQQQHDVSPPDSIQPTPKSSTVTQNNQPTVSKPKPSLFQPAFLQSSTSRQQASAIPDPQRFVGPDGVKPAVVGSSAGGLLRGMKPQSPLLAGMNPAALHRSSSGLWMPQGTESASTGVSAGGNSSKGLGGSAGRSLSSAGSSSSVNKWTASVSARESATVGGLYKPFSQKTSSPMTALVKTISPPAPFANLTAAVNANTAAGLNNTATSDPAKKEIKINNAESWSKIGSRNVTNSGSTSSGTGTSSGSQYFKQFQTQVQQKKEQELREEQERKAKREREEKLKAEQQQLREQQQRERAAAAAAAAAMDVNSAALRIENNDGDSVPVVEREKSGGADKPTEQPASERRKEIERLREQEKRRRAASARQIDMNAQSDLMTSFEYQIL